MNLLSNFDRRVENIQNTSWATPTVNVMDTFDAVRLYLQEDHDIYDPALALALTQLIIKQHDKTND
tara:strand:- start:16 stop:213 length:198 start_codon:yes stop_codon:yes gene_type:complete